MRKYLAGLLFGTLLFISCNPNGEKSIDIVPGPQPSLIDLCPKYGTDKCADRHNFIEFYHELFTPIRDSVSAVLEIGILNARSHLMWQEYFQSATVYGIDINDCSRYDSLGIKTFIADQSNRDQLNHYIQKYPGPYDIIIDDGGHHMDQQQISLGFFFKYLKPGGLFIVEDLHTSTPYYYNNYDGFGVNEDASNTTLEMIISYLQEKNWESQYLSKSELEFLNDSTNNVKIMMSNNNSRSMLAIISKKR